MNLRVILILIKLKYAYQALKYAFLLRDVSVFFMSAKNYMVQNIFIFLFLGKVQFLLEHFKAQKVIQDNL